MLINPCDKFFPEIYKIVHIYESADSYEFWLESETNTSICPICGTETTYIYGHQQRTVRDLPIFGKGVTLDITQRRYCCANSECEIDIFTEPNELVEPYSQFTRRCRKYMLKVAARVSCEAAMKILAYQGIRVSGDTLLNMVKAAGKEYKTEVGTKIGVDDWAYRRGQEYGTIICDLETHDVIEVLKGRDSETFEKWLGGHPDIKIVSRDRASEYSSAVKKALPEAVQIADRFHITKNLLEALNETMKGFMPEVIEIPVVENKKQAELAIQGTDADADFAEISINNINTEYVSIESTVVEIKAENEQTELSEENPALKKRGNTR